MKLAAPPTLGSRFVAALPGDAEKENRSRQVSNALYTPVLPEAVSDPRLLMLSPTLSAELGLDEAFCQSDSFARLMSGNELFPGVVPFATRYGGHQFGHWAGQLGDGRAINLGELVARDGRFMNLQLKGAGPTPYSRGADGRAVLRSSAREFLCSEAMHFLGVPTTRALSLVLTGDQVVRDMFYDGNPQKEPGAIVCRVAPSFTRFGHFQLCAYWGELDLLRLLIHQCIRDDFPHLGAPTIDSGKDLSRDLMLRWFEEICQSTARMIVHWMCLGFVHGVMNTDNMSVLGLTIDYGPYGWLDHFDPEWTPNTTDAQTRRYRYAEQPDIALWNLYQLANALLPVLEDVPSVEKILQAFPLFYENEWFNRMGEKLGLEDRSGDEGRALIRDLVGLLTLRETDMTLFFRALADLPLMGDVGQDIAVLQHTFYGSEPVEGEHLEQLSGWLQRYEARVKQEAQSPAQRHERMNRVNPWFILRNYLVQEALDRVQEVGDFSGLHALHAVLQSPYAEHKDFPGFHRKRPDWARHRAGASMLSCSS
ncbi:MAG: YdiU family protein [Pseudomonadales bacterium]|nr:YdiU family protein [Pseudomonadales bacterium]